MKVMDLEWFSVSDNLPKNKKNILGFREVWKQNETSEVLCDSTFVLCFYDANDKYFRSIDNPQVVVDISHWTDLPKTPIVNINQRFYYKSKYFLEKVQ